jgi:transcriptional regulator with XRE-family HTH domain
MGKAKKFRDADRNAPVWVVRTNKLLEERQWTQKEFAEKIDMSPSTVSDWIGTNKKAATEREPGMYAIQKIAECFGVSVDYLLGGNECKAPSDEEIHKLTGLSDEAISKLKKGTTLVARENFSAEKKMYMLNHLIETIGSSDLLESMYDYMFAEYHVKKPDGVEQQGAEVLITRSPSGKEKQIIAFNEIFAQASFADVQSDLVRMKDAVRAKREGGR